MSTSADRTSNFGYLIRDIAQLYTKLFENEADHLGITLADAKVLTSLSRNNGINQVQLAELAGVEPMSLVRILDRMEADRWIERRAHPTDRRARQIHLGKQAESTLEQILKVSARLRSQSLAGFKAEARNLLLEQMERVHTQLLQMLAAQTGKAQRLLDTDGAVPRARRKRAAPNNTATVPTRTGTRRVGKTLRAAR